MYPSTRPYRSFYSNMMARDTASESLQSTTVPICPETATKIHGVDDIAHPLDPLTPDEVRGRFFPLSHSSIYKIPANMQICSTDLR